MPTHFYSKELLCSRSDYFKGMFQSGFKEGEEQRATLPEDDAVVIDLFLEWLYKDRLSKIDLATSTETTGPFIDRIKLYQYAVKICLPSLQDYVMSDLMSNYEFHNREPSFRAVMLSYEVTSVGSPLRDFMARVLVQLIGTGDGNSSYAPSRATDGIMANPDLVRDMIRLIGERNERGNGTESYPWEMSRCKFHTHGVGEVCAYKSKTS